MRDVTDLMLYLASRVSTPHLVVTAVACLAWLAWCDRRGAR